MAMKRCPDCGERYSDTYKYCPFCEEEEILREKKRPARGGRRSSRSREFSLLTPVLVVLILIMAGLLVYLLRDTTDPGKDTPPSGSVDPVLPGTEDVGDDTGSGSDEKDPETDPGVMPDVPDVPKETDYEITNKLPDGLVLNKTDYTTKVGDLPVQLTASGGSGNYSWVSQDVMVASVDANGKVTAVGGGTVNVLVTDGEKKAVCIVRVKGGPAGTTPATTPSTGTMPPSGGSGNSGSSGSGSTSSSGTLNRDDFTLAVGEKFQLVLSGGSGNVTWSVGNSSVATVSGNGTVQGVSGGNTTVTASWNGGSAKCIVRVK